MAALSQQGLKDFMLKFAGGAGAGLVLSTLVTMFRPPLLSEPSVFGGATNNFNHVSTAISVGGTVMGITDLATGKSVLGFTKDAFPIFFGYGWGISQAPALAKLIGLDTFDPYSYIPQDVI